MTYPPSLRPLSILHILNDGFYASFLLLLPFLTKELHINLTQAGLLGTIMNSLGMFFALPAGYLATRIGGMKTLLLSALFYGIGYIGTGFAPTYLWLFPMFIIAGVGFALFHPIAFALVTRISAPAARGRTMGNFTALGDVGKMGISSVLTFIVVYLGWRFTALAYGIAAIGIAFVFLMFQQKGDRSEKVTVEKETIGVRDILKHPRYFFAVLTSFFDVFASASLFVFLPFLLLERGIDAALLGTFSAVYFLGNLFGKSVLGRFSDRFQSANIVIVSELLMALCIVVLARSTSVILIVLCSIIVGVFTKGTVPVIQTMIAEASEHHGQFEKSFAVSGLIGSIALTISPVFLGFLSDQWGITAAFYAMAILAAMAIVPAWLFQRVYTARA